MGCMFPRLHAVLAEPQVSPTPPRVWRDWAVIAVLAPAMVVEGILRPDLPWRVGCVVVALALLPTIRWRRTKPLAMVVVAFGCTTVAPFVLPGDPCQLFTASFLVLLVYALFRWGSGRDAVLGSFFVVAKVTAAGLVGGIDGGELVAGFAVMFAAATLGVAIRFRAAARLRELDQVKLLERERLARDLHDTVAHHVSAMAIRAQAGIAASASQPGAAVEALRTIEAEASRALAEMRAMVRVLRRDQPVDLAPNPQVADIERLAGHFRTGPTVDVDLPAISATFRPLSAPRSTGWPRNRSPTPVVTPATPPGSRSASRPTTRPCGCGSATTARPAPPPAGSPGFGLVGMMERADLLGGTCEAGPDPGRGWTVTAVLPRAGGRRVTVRVLVADDQEIVRTGLTIILNTQPGIEVVGGAGDGRQAVELARRLRPDVCLFDIRMPGMDGIEATRALAGPTVPEPLAVVVITTFDLDEYVYAALRAGARGFLLKEAGPDLLSQAVHAAANGDALIAPSVTTRLLKAFADADPAAPRRQPIEALTDREEQVLVAVARGRTNQEIADELYITLSTVKSHVTSLMTKLGVRNRVEVAMWAYETNRSRRHW